MIEMGTFEKVELVTEGSIQELEQSLNLALRRIQAGDDYFSHMVEYSFTGDYIAIVTVTCNRCPNKTEKDDDDCDDPDFASRISRQREVHDKLDSWDHGD